MRAFRGLLPIVVLLFAAGAAATPIPEVKFVQGSQPKPVLIGDEITFCLTFENTGNAVGYAPFIDLLFPSGGVDGAPNCDGIEYVSATVTSVNPPVPLTLAAPTPTTPCGPGGPTPHPYASSGVPPVLLPPGDQLVVLPLPFGSFEAGQPKLTIEVKAKVSPLADDGAGAVIDVRARGGYRFGGDPLDVTPNDNQYFTGSWETAKFNPQVVVLTKKYMGPDDEIVAGPSFSQNFRITADIAPGVTVSNLVLHDCATTGTLFTSVVSVPPGNPSPLTNCFDITYPSPITGDSPNQGADIDITATFHAGPSFVQNPSLCAVTLRNRANVQQGSWLPLDPRDGTTPQALSTQIAAGASLTVKPIAIRKRVQVLGGAAVPGATLRYTIDLQVSDYVRFGNLVIVDTLSNGLLYLNNPRLTVRDRGGNVTAVAFPPNTAPFGPVPNGTYRCPGGMSSCGDPLPATSATLPGGTGVRFLLSNALTALGWPAPGILTGSLVPTAVTVPTSAQIVFDARIQQTFSPPIGDDKFVDKDDPLLNHAQLKATRFAPNSLKQIGTCGDDADACTAVPDGKFEKRVVAINSGTSNVYLSSIPLPLAPPAVQPGDRVTFRFTKSVPSGDAEKITIQDWFPEPAFAVSGANGAVATPCGPTPPAANTVCYSIAPARVWTNTPLPQVSWSGPSPTGTNSMTVDFGSFQGSTTMVTITVEVTLQATFAPMADELLLTNEAQECESTSYGARVCQTVIAQVQMLEPSLVVRKGIRCTNGKCPAIPPDPGDDNNPTTELLVAPTLACNPTILCPRVTGTVNSSNVAAFTAPAAGLADAGDKVTFVVTIENAGHFPAWDITVDDPLGPPWSIVPGSICVRRGDGALMPTTTPTFPLTFIDPSTTQGALDPRSPASGTNIIVIVFDAILGSPSQVTIGDCYKNVASLTSYSNQEVGENFVDWGFGGPFSATAAACVKPKALVKSLVTSSEAHTPMPKLTIGEIVTYRLVFDVPEGTATNFHVVDPLQPDLQLIGNPSISTSGVNTTLTWSQFVWATTNVDFDLGTVTNNDNDPDCERIVIQFNALVRDTAANAEPQTKPNAFRVEVNGTPIGTSNTVNVQIVEPKLTVAKTASMFHNVPRFTVTITNVSSVTAFDVTVSDLPGACLQNLQVVSVSPTTGVSGTNPLTIQSIPPGGVVTITYQFSFLCKRCIALGNDVKVTWTSLPGGGTSPNPTGSVTPPGEERDYTATASASLCGAVTGTKFNDLDGNGKPDPGEAGLPGWTITATDANGNVVATTVTGTNGAYQLDLLPGTYTICETPQPGWTQTVPSNPKCHTVTVTIGTTQPGRDFGNKECWATICGTKTAPKPGTPGTPLAGWTIVAWPNGGGAPISTTTDAAGRYCLKLPGPGQYTISEVQQNGWNQLPPLSYTVVVECVKSPAGEPGTPIVQGGGNPQAVNFRNENVCANTTCPAPSQCISINGQPKCVTPPPVSPCALIKCGFGTHCAEINGQAVCVP